MTTPFTIPKTLTKGDDLIVIKKKEYLQMKQQLMEIADAVQAIREGEEAYRKGKTKVVSSLQELL